MDHTQYQKEFSALKHLERVKIVQVAELLFQALFAFLSPDEKSTFLASVPQAHIHQIVPTSSEPAAQVAPNVLGGASGVEFVDIEVYDGGLAAVAGCQNFGDVGDEIEEPEAAQTRQSAVASNAEALHKDVQHQGSPSTTVEALETAPAHEQRAPDVTARAVDVIQKIGGGDEEDTSTALNESVNAPLLGAPGVLGGARGVLFRGAIIDGGALAAVGGDQNYGKAVRARAAGRPIRPASGQRAQPNVLQNARNVKFIGGAVARGALAAVGGDQNF